MDSCSFLIYYLVCFIQKLLQTGCYIKYGKIHLCNQLIMSTLLNDTSVFHNKNQICISDG